MKHQDLLLKLELQSNLELLCAVRGAMERLTEKNGQVLQLSRLIKILEICDTEEALAA